MKRVYLAYAPAAAQRADELRRILLAQGFRPWIDAEPRESRLWHHAIDGAIRNADALILLQTSEASESVNITYECAYALGCGIPVFIIVIDDAALHPRLRDTPRFDLRQFTDENRFWDHFIAEFRQRMQPERPPASARQPRYLAPPQIDRAAMPEAPGSWIVVRRGPIVNAMFRLGRDVVNLGRDGANDIVIADLRVSRFHLRILADGSQHRIQDLDSANGTRVNGVLATASEALQQGDVISLGDAVDLTYERVDPG